MPIINVNTFQDGISKKDFLTTYTDVYLKQALANLGQRVGIKGDSIINNSFYASEMFPDYLGDFNEQNKFIMMEYNTSYNTVTGTIVCYDSNKGTVRTIEELSTTANPGSTFTINNISNILTNINDNEGYETITLSDGNTKNGIGYYHSDSAIIQKTDKWYQYSLLGHKDGANEYANYDKEYIIERISIEGELLDSIRICIKNEEKIEEAKKSGNDIHEHLCIFHLYKNDKYEKDKSSKYYLDLYNVAGIGAEDGTITGYWEIGDFIADITNKDIDVSIEQGTEVGTSPTDILNYIYDNKAYPIGTQDLVPSLQKITDSPIPIDYDTEKNIIYSISNDYQWWSGNKLIGSVPCNNIDEDDNISDKEFIENKLQYFNDDLVNLFPRIQEIFNDIIYNDTDGTKLKRKIFAELVTQLYKQENIEDNLQDSFIVYLPCDYELVYNCNSNNSTIIYNTVQNINVQFVNDYISNDNITNIYDYIYSISNNRENDNIIISSGSVIKTAQYFLTITYLEDNIINNINWNLSFIMPYIDSNGYWVINGVVTDINAEGIAESISNLIIMSSISNEGDYEILHASDKNLLNNIGFELSYTNVNITGTDNIKIGAWVPSSSYLLSSADNKILAATKNAMIINMSSAYMQAEPNIYDNIQYFNTINITYIKEYYNKYHEIPQSYLSTDKNVTNDWIVYIGEDILNTNNTTYTYTSYICTISEDSLLYTLGQDAIITTIWHAEYDNENSCYKFTYIPRPDDSNLSLDLQYLTGLEQYVKYYSIEASNPDNSIFKYIVFEDTNTATKNNSDEKQHKSWPVIKNNKASEYIQKENDIVSSITNGTSDYQNNLNFTIGFYDDVNVVDGTISSEDISNSLDRHFHINTYSYTVNIPKISTYINDEGNPAIKLIYDDSTKKEFELGTIPFINSIKEFYKEYFPDAGIYENNAYQYPYLDIREILVRNANIINRTNIISTGKVNIGDDQYKNVLYNAYIGTAYDNEDKSILHIGTSKTNISLGTTTMVSNEDIYKLNKMEGLSIDFDSTYINGDLNVKGNLVTDSIVWNKNKIDDNYTLYSTILYPSDILLYKRDGATDYKDKVFYCETKDRIKETRYVKNISNESTISYLNINNLFKKNNIEFNDISQIKGDPQVLTYTIENTGISYLLELSADLNNPENFNYVLDDKIVSSNPIQVSYIDIPYSNIEYTTESINKKVYAYLYGVSYTENWYCNGCDLCNGLDCKMIQYCNKSSVTGYATYAYGFTYDPDSINSTSAHYYSVEVLRYPNGYNIEDKETHGAVTHILYFPYDKTTDENNNTIYKGKNVLCTSMLKDLYDTSTYFNVIIKEDGTISKSEESNQGSYVAYISNNEIALVYNTYIYSYYDDVTYDDLKEQGINHKMAFSYNGIAYVQTSYNTQINGSAKTYTTHQRMFNVREIITSHSRPLYYNNVVPNNI